MPRQQKLYHQITLRDSSPGGCCKLRYWSRLRALEVTPQQRQEIATCRERPFKIPNNNYIESRYRDKMVVQGVVFPERNSHSRYQFGPHKAMPKTLIFNLLLAQAVAGGGVLFMIDNVSGLGDFERGDITIRDFCNWLGKRKQKFGTLRKIPNLTYRKHLTAWLYSPNDMSEPYPRPKEMSPEWKFMTKVANDLEKWATRRATGEV